MNAGKDSNEVVEFMVLFQKLRDLIADDPVNLELRAAADEVLKRLCNDVGLAAFFLSMNEKRQRRLFSAPVDSKFIGAWRTYEEKYASPISGIFLSDLGLGPTDDWRDFGAGFRENIEEGTSAWDRLKKETGFDLRGYSEDANWYRLCSFPGMFRNTTAIPKSSRYLRIFKKPMMRSFSAFILPRWLLMRSVLEATLKTHYQAPGKDLKERIENCEGLPHRCSKSALHRIRNLTNDILHFEKDKIRLPDDFERELLRLLNVLRALIEGVPSSRPL